MMPIGEFFIDIPGYPDYRVSNMGSVLSNRTMTPKILNGNIDIEPKYPDIKYRTYTLYEPRPSKGKKNMRGHEIVMLAFFGKTPKGKVIIHKNGNSLDDRLENLEYAVHPSILRLKEAMKGLRKS